MWVRVEKIIVGSLFIIGVGYFVISYISGIAGDKHPLMGQKVPELTLKKMDGYEVLLSSIAKGKKAIVIDFWATWCGPCREALPAMEKLAREYDPNHVLFLGINVRDGDIKAIKKFLSDKEIKTVNILLDKEETAGQKYSFRGIPAIFVLDGDMKVQNFYYGYSSSVDSGIKRAIDAIIK